MSSGNNPPQDAATRPSWNPEPFYTNEDVAVLHNIVLLAEEILPGLPERERLPTNALFSAYYDILPRVGVNADHDSRYARILFKIGGLWGPGTIYEKFEEILSRMGIEIEFDHEEEEQYSPFDGPPAGIGSIAEEEPRKPQGRRRRNSESSVWDLGTEIPLSNNSRPRSASPLHRLSPQRRAGNFIPRDAKSLQQRPDPTPSENKAERDSAKQNIRSWLASSHEKSRRGRERSTSRPRSLQVRRSSPTLKSYHRTSVRAFSVGSEEFEAPSEITAVTSAQEQQIPDSPKPIQGHPLNNTSEDLMQVKASPILQRPLSFLIKRQLYAWRDKALQLRIYNINRNSIASIHDRKALLELALETWHDRLVEKLQIAATERFFAHLERRSERVRDLYLLEKAFTHWRVCAFDEAERTSIARRHIIRARTFNAWREITVVNELKVRRQVMKKFFSVWKRRHLILYANTVTAVQKFEENLAEKSYRKWIRKGWHIKAALWWAEGTKLKIFSSWNLAFRSVLNDYNAAKEHDHLKLLWRTWQILQNGIDERFRKEQQANNIYQIRICSKAISKWRGEARVIPAKIALQADVSLRLLRETIGTWVHRSREERRAVAIDRLRILREAFTTWRHRARFQLTHGHVNDRVVQEAMYKWILRARIIFTERKLYRNILRHRWQNWVHETGLSRKQRWNREDQAEDFGTRNAQNLVLSRWNIRLGSQLHREMEASELYRSNISRHLLFKWSERTQRLRQLHQWSRVAEFYLLASKTLKRWKSSTESAKREKRKAAYAQVRRMTKLNSVRGKLLSWCQQAKQVIELRGRAQEMSQNKNVIIGMDIFDRWRARTEELGDLETLWQEKTLRKQFISWKRRSFAFQDLEVEAIINYQERQQSRAVKKWSLLTLQLRSQSYYAAEIRDKNVKRTFRKTFSYWHQRTVQKRPFLRTEMRQEPQSQLGATARGEAWSDLGDDGEVNAWARELSDANPLTPVPGYLSTPSKRMGRVSAAAARFSSTTPRALLSTPFERQLRAQYSRDGLLSAQNPSGRSRPATGGGFADIADREGR